MNAIDFADCLIIILPAFAAAVIAWLPWTDEEVEATAEFWKA